MSLELENYLKEVHKSKKSAFISPVDILEMFGANRRGWKVTESINNLLKQNDLIALPDFGTAYCYGLIELKERPKVGVPEHTNLDDLVPKLGNLRAANLNVNTSDSKKNGLISLSRNATIMEAVTLMIKHDISQIPILSGREAIGIISWKTIGSALALGKKCTTVMDCIKPVDVLSANTPLFTAVEKIVKGDTVLVKQHNNEITGIVTAKNIGEQFIEMSTPFLLLEQIENHIRKLLADKLVLEDIKRVLDEEKLTKPLTDLTSLSFGNYVIILEDKENYTKLNIKIERKILIELLKETNNIRNNVMHFNPEGLKSEQVEHLKETLRMLRVLVDACH